MGKEWTTLLDKVNDVKQDLDKELNANEALYNIFDKAF